MTLYSKIIAGVLCSILVMGCGGDITQFAERIPMVQRTQFIEHAEDWRNLRYGEILPIFRSGFNIYVEVYNTISFNELPQDQWDKIDADALAEEFGAQRVIKNGPRYWLVNKIDSRDESENGKIASFGGIEMMLRGKVQFSILDGGLGKTFYAEKEINRATTFHFYKGNRVYELTSPKGEVYRMQSYAQIIDKTLTIDQLENLGERLDLPDGWSYHARILDSDVAMIADGVAYVINDELGNSYQKVLD